MSEGELVFVPSEHSRRECNTMLSSVVVPRPIAMISTVSADGLANLAPYSYYQPVTWSPMLVSVAIGMRGADRRNDSDATGFKDTYLNAVATGDFVVNVTTDRFRGMIEVPATEFPPEVDEFDHVPWTPIASRMVTAPSVAEAPARLECRVFDVLDYGDGDAAVKLMVGKVECIVADEALARDGAWLDAVGLEPIGRLGGRAYVTTSPASVYTEQRVSIR